MKLGSNIYDNIIDFLKKRSIEFVGLLLITIFVFFVFSLINYAPEKATMIFKPDGLSEGNLFEIYGITVHLGKEISGGHYVSYIKKPTFNINYLNKYSSDKNVWIKFNDSHVDFLSYESFEKELNEKEKGIYHNCYILYYKKINKYTMNDEFPHILNKDVGFRYYNLKKKS